MIKTNNKAFILFFALFLWYATVQPTYARATKPELVVLIHGLMRTSTSMFFLKHYLQGQGYQVEYYNYPSARYSLHEHSQYLYVFIQQLFKEYPHTKIHFVTHSMGGIIVREALSQLPARQLQHIGNLVMLAPPNQGSELAKMTTEVLPLISYAIKPLAELSSEQHAYVHHVPIPPIKMGIIVGRFDAKVPPDSGRLQDNIELRVVNSTHTFIMNNATARHLIVQFLHTGTFT